MKHFMASLCTPTIVFKYEKNVLMEQKNEGIFTCNDNCLKKCCILKLAGFHKAIFFGLRT